MPCAANATLAAVVTSDDFVVAALCLHTQLQRLGSQCPLLLLFDKTGEGDDAAAASARSSLGLEEKSGGGGRDGGGAVAPAGRQTLADRPAVYVHIHMPRCELVVLSPSTAT